MLMMVWLNTKAQKKKRNKKSKSDEFSLALNVCH